jgi:23S rRNA (cytidine1920-2'-O)/16S rRNA (cytidine1409-2'-O)-methyltransferase
VLVAGAVADKPARLVAPSDPVELRADPPRFVGRGGLKLEAALERFDLDVDGLRVLDVGASTGGFTDCLLGAGAREVVAVDVGHGQLHEHLRADPRVVVRESTDIRVVDLDHLGGRPVDAAVADLSFISLKAVVAGLLDLVHENGPVVLLVKPQFEAGRVEASRGRGVIRDPAVHRRCLSEVAASLERAGADVSAAMASPVLGRSGNREFFLLARRPGADGGADSNPSSRPSRDGCLDRLLDEVVAEAESARQDGS